MALLTDDVFTSMPPMPAFGAYVRSADGTRHFTSLFVIALAGDKISALVRFDASVLPWFGLPRSLPAARPGS